MHDARDAEDTRLLEAGDHDRLLDNYVYLVEQWCLVRLRDRDAAEEVAQRVFLRLWKELKKGRRYRVPYRVVVWKVVQYACQGYDWERKQADDLPDDWDPEAPDDYEDWASNHDLAAVLSALPGRQREVAELAYLDDLAAPQIAERLGMTPNAVHQALFNAHKKLAETYRAA